jgi:hypothetical protein
MSKSCLRASLVAIVSILFLAPTPAHADTYQLVGLGIDNTQFYGMTDSGAVVLYASFFSCGNPATGCYETFLNGVNTGDTDIAPTDTWDNGTPCSPALPPGGSALHAVCNNGRNAWTGYLTSGQVIAGVYSGLTPLFQNGGYGPIFMNDQGDVVFDEEVGDEWYEAIDLTAVTPEPGSIVLLSTGVLALATILTLRRRRLAHA